MRGKCCSAGGTECNILSGAGIKHSVWQEKHPVGRVRVWPWGDAHFVLFGREAGKALCRLSAGVRAKVRCALHWDYTMGTVRLVCSFGVVRMLLCLKNGLWRERPCRTHAEERRQTYTKDTFMCIERCGVSLRGCRIVIHDVGSNTCVTACCTQQHTKGA